MNVLLVGPDYEENLSIRYLSSSLLKAGHKVELASFNSADNIDSVVSVASKTELIGLSMCFQVRAREFLKLAREIKREYPEKLIVAGGHYASCSAKDLLIHHPEIDLIVIHEGERTLVELADSGCDLKKRLSKIRGIVYREGDEVCYTEPRPIIENLDSFPIPDRRGPIHMLANVPTAYILGSRGCLGSCDYCCISTLHRLAPGKRFRQRSPENIADEMAILYHEMGIRQFIYHDDNFLLPSADKNLKRIKDFEAALNERKINNIAFAIKCRPADVDYDVFCKLKQMGLLRVFLGIESANSAGLSSIGRKQTVTDSEKALEICEKLGISSQYTIMVFHPEATISTLREDIAFMRRHINHPLHFVRVESFAGTPLEKRLIEEGRSEGDYLARYYHLLDPAADLACTISKKNFLKRCWINDNLMDFAIGVDHLSEVMKYFYKGAEVDNLYKTINGWWLEVNRDSLDLLERLVNICDSDPYLLHTRTKVAIQELMEEEAATRKLLYLRGEELRGALEELTLRMVGLNKEGTETIKLPRRKLILARHTAAVMLALSIAGGVPTIGIADPPSPPLEEDSDGDGLYDLYEIEIFGTDFEKRDTDGDGNTDDTEDHDGDKQKNLEEQVKMLNLLDAVEIGDTETVKNLLEAGAYVDAIDDEEMTALIRASMHGHTETVKALLDAGANINAKDNNGSTALMHAAGRGRIETIKVLLDAGADVNAKNSYGYTALKFARRRGSGDIVKLLKEAGAKK